MTATTTVNTASSNDTPSASQPAPPGAVAGTALRAARLSARLSQAQLAAAISTAESAVAAWEDGTDALADISYPLLQQLEAALTAASADPALVADLAIGTWCDLVLAALTDPAELLCLLSDPLAAEPAFGELLTWAAESARPERYRPYAGPGPLLRNTDLGCAAAVIRLREITRSAGRHAA